MDNYSQKEPSTRPVSRRGLRSSAGSSIESSVPSSSMGAEMVGSTISVGENGRLPTGLRTASHLASALSSGRPIATATSSQRIGTALGYAGNLMKERPITQHGLSGLSTGDRLGTAANRMNRVVKDKRYWMAIVQAKMTEIRQETDKLLTERHNMNREQSAKKLYDRKVKDAAKELTDLQAQLTDMNIALDSFGSGSNRQNLQREAAALRERNEFLQNQLEALFGERQIKEERNKQIEQEIEIEKNKINDMIHSLPLEEQAKYREYQALAEDLKARSTEMLNSIEQFSNQKDRLVGIVTSSQMRMEALRLQKKLRELTTKLQVLREEEENKLTPEQEREKLIHEVRSNNQALTSINHQMKVIEDQLNEKKEQLQLIEQDLEEGNSERHAKYKELKRRDETMTKFLESFQEQLISEQRNLEKLKNQIAYAIEQITLQGMNLKSFGLSNLDLLNEKNDLNSQTGLLKEYKRISIQLKQLQLLENRTSSQLKQLEEEETNLGREIQTYCNLDALRSDAAENMDVLTTKLEELKKKEKITEEVVIEARNRNQEIKEHLRSNETYKQLSHLEEKLVDLLKENKTLKEVVEQNRKENDYSELKIEVDKLTDVLNKALLENNSENYQKF